MSFLSRTRDILGGVGSSMKAQVGFVADVATAPFTSDDFGELKDNLSHAVTSRGKEYIDAVIGDKGAVSSAWGALPGQVKTPVKSALGTINNGLNRLYNDAVSRPTSALWLNAAHSVNDNTGTIAPWKQFLRKSSWTGAWDEAQGVSPGQSFALANAASEGRVDLNNDDSIQKFIGTDYFKHFSGGYDAISRTFLDPTIVGGKAIVAARGLQAVRAASIVEDAATGAKTVKAVGLPKIIPKETGVAPKGLIGGVATKITGADKLTGAQQIDAVTNSSKFLKANLAMENKSGAEIAQRYFANEADGGLIGELYATAGTVENRQNLTRFLMGDQHAWNALNEQSTALTNQLDRLYGVRAVVADEAKFGNDPTQLSKVQAEIDELHPHVDNINRKAQVWGALNQVPDNTVAGAARTALTRSDFYQKSPLAAPLRVINRKQPEGLLNVSNADTGTAYTQVQRQLERSNLPQAERDNWLQQFANATGPEQRQHVYEQAEQSAISSVLQRNVLDADGNITLQSMTRDEAEKLLNNAGYQTGRGVATQHLAERSYDGDPNRSMVKRWDEDGYELVHTPLWETQNARVIPMVDLDRLKQVDKLRPAALNKVEAIGNELLSSYNQVWKASTLIRLGYPVRVQADQQMRILAKIGALTQVKNIAEVGSEFAQGIKANVRNRFDIGELGVGSTVRVNRGELGKVIAKSDDMVRVRTRSGDVVSVPMDDIRFAQLSDFGIGQKNFRAGNYLLDGAFSNKRDDAEMVKAGISGRKNIGAFVDENEKTLLNRFVSPDEVGDIKLPDGTKFLGSHRSLSPVDPADVASYPAAWEHAVNNVIGQSELGKKLLAGESPEAVKVWLKNTTEGRALAKRMSPLRGSFQTEALGVRENGADAVVSNARSGLPALFHGSKDFDDLETRQLQNLVGFTAKDGNFRYDDLGPGFYSTNDKNVAKYYAHDQGMRTAYHKASTYHVEFKPDRQAKLLNATQPMPEDVRNLVRQTLEADGYPLSRDELAALSDAGTFRDFLKTMEFNFWGPKGAALEKVQTKYRTLFERINQDLGYDVVYAGHDAAAGGGAQFSFLNVNDLKLHKSPALGSIVPVQGESAADKWVDVAHDAVESITDGNAALKALALEGKATFNDLKQAIPEAAKRPVVHGQQLVQGLAEGSMIKKALSGFTTKAFHLLGTLPDDMLARQPLYKSLYETEAKRLINLIDDATPIDDAIITQIQKQSRISATRSTQDLLFDMANQTDLARMLRFMSPFYMAWQDSMARWTATAIERPDTIAQIRNLWHAPERAGLIRDENGNIVNDDGTATNPMTGEKVDRGKEKYVTFMKPDWMKIPGTENGSRFAFNKRTFNLLLSGSPGVGPIAALPLNYWVKGHPDQESMFKWALPYGAQSTKSLIEPTLARRIDTAFNEDNDTNQKLALRIYQTKMTDYRMSLGGPHELPEPTFADAQEQAKHQSYVRIAAGLVLPFVPTFQSPYQIYIDAYRRAQATTRDNPSALGKHVNGDDVTPDEWFTDTYGDEMFYLTQSLTKSYDGVNPTTGGYEQRKKYQKLVEDHPELGGFITGVDGAGSASAAFNSSFYTAQSQDKVSPGSSHKQRETLSGDDFNTKAQASEGWRQYTKYMDMIDAEMHERGLDNINVKGARDIKQVKQNLVTQLSQQYPGWFDDYQQSDRGAFQKKIEGFKAITEDDSQMQRPEVQGVKQYLDAREGILKELSDRKKSGGSATITAHSNADVLRTWDNFTTTIAEGNLSFSQTYHRYLENDPMEQS